MINAKKAPFGIGDDAKIVRFLLDAASLRPGSAESVPSQTAHEGSTRHDQAAQPQSATLSWLEAALHGPSRV